MSINGNDGGGSLLPSKLTWTAEVVSRRPKNPGTKEIKPKRLLYI